jgi:hypothetical protein
VPDPGLRDEIVRRARAAGIPLDERPLAQARAVVDAAAERAALAARTGAAFVDLESARWAAQAIAARRAWAVVRFVTDSPERPLARLAPVLGGDPARPPGAAQVAWRLARRPDLMLALAGLAAGFLRGRARVERLL